MQLNRSVTKSFFTAPRAIRKCTKIRSYNYEPKHLNNTKKYEAYEADITPAYAEKENNEIIEMKFIEELDDYQDFQTEHGLITAYEAMNFAGPIPEAVNGRLTMIGFVAGVVAEMCSGKTLFEQFEEATLPVILFSIIITFASFYPILYGMSFESASNGIFNKKAEFWNGRAAMLGFTTMLVIESLQHHSMFPKIF
jgi:hypothetical protein